MPVERVLTYDQPASWQLVICHGQVFYRCNNRACRLANRECCRLLPVSAEYLAQRWCYCPVRGWHVVPEPTRMACLFYRLAIYILPEWEFHVLPNYSRAQRKAWSHMGATARGDLGNRTYKLVLHVAQLLRQRLGYARLYQIDQLGVEKAGDVLEGIMGLQYLGQPWDPTGIVSRVSINVERMWCFPELLNQWNYDYLAEAMYSGMNLHSIVDDFRYRIHVAKVTKKTSIALTIACVVGLRCAAYVNSFL